MSLVTVDTSVWIDFFRGGRESEKMLSLLDAGNVLLPVPVKLELLSKMLKKKLIIHLISEITGMSEDEIQRFQI